MKRSCIRDCLKTKYKGVKLLLRLIVDESLKRKAYSATISYKHVHVHFDFAN